MRSRTIACFSYGALVILMVGFLAVNLRWLWLYRYGQPLDVDESGYLSLAVIDYRELLYGGLHGWFAAIEMPSIQAPLTTALASLLFAVAGPHVILAFGVPLASAAGCILVAHVMGGMLGRALDVRGVGLTAAALTASCPVIVNYARSFQFSLPAAFLTTLALLAILRARHFRSLGWVLVFAASLGLMPLARTMTIAFLPGLIAAAGLSVIVDPAQRMRRLLVLAGALLLASAVAAVWLYPNGRLVAGYLLSFGYGARAAEYGPQSSKFGLDAWRLMAQAFVREIYLPHFLLILAGISAAVALFFLAIVQHGVRFMVLAALRSPVAPALVFVAEAMLALTSSGNKGSGFFAPVLPTLMVLSVCAVLRIGRSLSFRPAAILPACVVLIAAGPLLDLRTPFAREWIVDVPGLDVVTVTDGRGTLQRVEARAGYGALGATQPLDKATSRAWTEASAWTAGMLDAELGQHALVAFGFRHELYNVNTINLQHLLTSGSAFGVYQVEPAVTEQSVQGYRGWLADQAAKACALLTSDRLGADFPPPIDRAFMEEAARQAGLVPGRIWPLPDGQVVTLWRRLAAPLPCR